MLAKHLYHSLPRLSADLIGIVDEYAFEPRQIRRVDLSIALTSPTWMCVDNETGSVVLSDANRILAVDKDGARLFCKSQHHDCESAIAMYKSRICRLTGQHVKLSGITVGQEETRSVPFEFRFGRPSQLMTHENSVFVRRFDTKDITGVVVEEKHDMGDVRDITLDYWAKWLCPSLDGKFLYALFNNGSTISEMDWNGQCQRVMELNFDKGVHGSCLSRFTAVEFVVDGQGRFWMIDHYCKLVLIFSRHGQFMCSMGLGVIVNPGDICIDKQGQVYICDLGANSVFVFST